MRAMFYPLDPDTLPARQTVNYSRKTCPTGSQGRSPSNVHFPHSPKGEPLATRAGSRASRHPEEQWEKRPLLFTFALSRPRKRPASPFTPLHFLRKFAFFNRLSYWWLTRCAETCARKSMATTTTTSSEVPPK